MRYVFFIIIAAMTAFCLISFFRLHEIMKGEVDPDKLKYELKAHISRMSIILFMMIILTVLFFIIKGNLFKPY